MHGSHAVPSTAGNGAKCTLGLSTHGNDRGPLTIPKCHMDRGRSRQLEFRTLVQFTTNSDPDTLLISLSDVLSE